MKTDKLPKEFEKYFNEASPDINTDAKDGIYAFDLRDESDFLITLDHDLEALRASGDFIFGYEKTPEQVLQYFEHEAENINKRSHKETVQKELEDIVTTYPNHPLVMKKKGEAIPIIEIQDKAGNKSVIFLGDKRDENVKLFLAAPKLLEALKEFLIVINRSETALMHYGKAINKANEAIREAESC